MRAVFEITRSRAGVLHFVAALEDRRKVNKKGENGLMAHYCECYRRIVLKSAARHARAGWIYRPGHDLCRKCWRSLFERQAIRTEALGAVALPYWVGAEESAPSAHIIQM